jgi:hypothetical protein
MGLTIHYSFKTDAEASHARKMMASLHRAAEDLPFKELGSVVELAGPDCDFGRRDREDPLRWILCQAEGSVRVTEKERENGEALGGDTWLSVAPSRFIGFCAWPGEGCEESNFGLCQYPAELSHPTFGKVKTQLTGWRWSSFCKTQYASDPNCGGVANFLQCHLTVIALLDQAKAFGLLEKASDEGGFWVKRDVTALANEVGSWNQMVAAFGGRLKDLLGEGLQTAISEYPNFEQLEAAGQSQLSPGIEALARLIRQVVKERTP